MKKGYIVSNIQYGMNEGYYNEPVDVRSISLSSLFNPFVTSSKYNMELILKLNSQYNVSIAKIARLLNVKRETINTPKKKKQKCSFIGNQEYFNTQIEEILINMIGNYEIIYNKNEIMVEILWGEKIGEIAVLYKYGGIVNCIFNPDKLIGELLDKNRYYSLFKGDIELLNSIGKNTNVEYYTKWNNDNSKCRIEDSKLKKLLNNNIKRNGVDEAEYYNLIGLKNYTYLDEVEDRLYKVFKNNLDADGVVKIQSYDKVGKQSVQSVKVSRDLKTLGKSREELAIEFGFVYKKKVYRGDTMQKHKKIIENRYIVEANKIYINSQDNFYNNLHGISKNNNMSFDEYIGELGFVRIAKHELPSNYQEYNWREYENNNYETIKEIVIMILEEISSVNKEVYIESNSYEYNTLWKYSYIMNLKLNELIEECNYKRIYDKQIIRHVQEQDKDKDKDKILSIEEQERIETLRLLNNLDKSTSKELVTSSINKRNKQLPKLLKKLYLHKCQLCSDQVSLPVIEMLNGEEYVEVHHITQLSQVMDINDESYTELDSYKNCIVVCCYHHKYLHLHQGGFKRLKNISGSLFFETEDGDSIEVNINYHLEGFE
ncbi:hypothetical protein [Clostridium gasigenes]|uniref:hypothetical protein n=1 Tax=Clostridium gasigenes TaxID=94869 RepID=UPI001C0E7852|nr:hypothetical protein [Clostridium gasigenes]MBU3102562.1 hypothetical protein [Clostridium gasigenes]